MSDSQLKHICDSLYHIVNIKVLAGGEVFDLFEGVHRPAVREKEKNWDFFIENIESEALCRSLVSS